jgi:hypothetical protein
MRFFLLPNVLLCIFLLITYIFLLITYIFLLITEICCSSAVDVLDCAWIVSQQRSFTLTVTMGTDCWWKLEGQQKSKGRKRFNNYLNILCRLCYHKRPQFSGSPVLQDTKPIFSTEEINVMLFAPSKNSKARCVVACVWNQLIYSFLLWLL